ncbi:MAG: hypothetical protein ACLUIQ_04605 [Dialister invisus]
MANYNPYENMLHVLDKAAEVLGYKRMTMNLCVIRKGTDREHSDYHG